MVIVKSEPTGLRNAATFEAQFPTWPLEADSKSDLIMIFLTLML